MVQCLLRPLTSRPDLAERQFVAFLGDPKKSGFINGSALQIDGGIGGRLYDPE